MQTATAPDTRKLKVLFVHENFPAQFGQLGLKLAQEGWDICFATAADRFEEGKVSTIQPGPIRVVRYKRSREVRKGQHPYLVGTERAILNGQGFARVAFLLREKGFVPDIVVAHSGWGSGSLCKVIWPDTKFIQYLEWWYNFPPVDVPEMDGERPLEDRHASTLCKNLPFLLDAQSADAILVPTAFQAEQLPDWLSSRVTVMHDGVDTEAYRPQADEDTRLAIKGVPNEAPIVTYATRGMEPTRGFPEFMRAIPGILAGHPETHIVIAGTDSIHYGSQLPTGQSWKKRMIEEVQPDMSRVHFVGRLDGNRYRALLRRSDVHVYLTRPFVLSWSLIEAMASGCAVVASDTPPVKEVMKTKRLGVRVDHNDPRNIAAGVLELLRDPKKAASIGKSARNHILKNYAQDVIIPSKKAFFKAIAIG